MLDISFIEGQLGKLQGAFNPDPDLLLTQGKATFRINLPRLD